jgi:hypothetical protein
MVVVDQEAPPRERASAVGAVRVLRLCSACDSGALACMRGDRTSAPTRDSSTNADSPAAAADRPGTPVIVVRTSVGAGPAAERPHVRNIWDPHKYRMGIGEKLTVAIESRKNRRTAYDDSST